MDPKNQQKAFPETKHLINKKAVDKEGRPQKATLKTLAYGSRFGSVSGETLKTINYSNQDLSPYTISQTISTFDLWVTEVNFGYGITGRTAASQYYNKFYSQYYRKNPIQVKGICKNEIEYNELATFIRKQQVNVTADSNNMLQLEVPGGGINAIGIIPNFNGGVDSKKQGIPIAPDFVFDFIVVRDLTDKKDSSQIKDEYQISYFTNNNPLTSINDVPTRYAIYSKNSDGGFKPFNLKNYVSPKTSGTQDPNSAINGGAGGARGGAT